MKVKEKVHFTGGESKSNICGPFGMAVFCFMVAALFGIISMIFGGC